MEKTYAKPESAPHYRTFKELMYAADDIYGSRDMFREKEGKTAVGISPEAFRSLTRRIGAALLTHGLLNGKKIALIGEASVEWIASYFASVIGGNVIVPIDKELPDDEIANIINDSGAEAVIYSESFFPVMQNICENTLNVTHFIGMDAVPTGERFFSLKHFVENADFESMDSFDLIETDPDKMCAILYTSGTTGKSKGVMLSQKNILECARGHSEFFKQGDVCMSVLPIHHSYEFSIGIVGSIINGSTICINDSLRYFLPNLALFKPKCMYVVPAFVEMLYNKIWANAKAQGKDEQLKALIEKSNAEREKGIDNRSVYFKDIKDALGGELELLISGGAPLSAFYSKAFRDMGIMLLQGYGITECSPLVSVNPEWANKDGSIGPAISCCEVKITDPDENGNGEIWVKGENVMLGYYKDPDGTAEVMDGEWFDTGDIGYMDEDGYIYITGRRKNLIILANGKNIYPEEIEEYLSRIPYIKDAVVIADSRAVDKDKKIIAEIVIEDNLKDKHTNEEITEILKRDIAKINKTLPLFKQIADFRLREKDFEKTTKKTIKRFAL